MGAPLRARIKTYAAETGYTYQYVYRGYHTGSDTLSRHFVFQIWSAVSRTLLQIDVRQTEMGHCEQHLGRPLAEQEKYAIAKLALFRTFDSSQEGLPEAVSPSGRDMLEFLETLGRA